MNINNSGNTIVPGMVFNSSSSSVVQNCNIDTVCNGSCPFVHGIEAKRSTVVVKESEISTTHAVAALYTGVIEVYDSVLTGTTASVYTENTGKIYLNGNTVCSPTVTGDGTKIIDNR
jgi:hypothetical protein